MPSTIFPIRLAIFLMIVSLASMQNRSAFAGGVQDPDVRQVHPESDRIGYRVRIPLPITNAVSQSLKQTLKRLVEKSPAVVQPNKRPVVVLEFDTSGGKTGQGSDLNACIALARFITQDEFNRVQTVAYIPSSRGLVGIEVKGLRGQLNGHAVLVAIAANQLAMDPQTAIGKSGIDEQNLDFMTPDIYRLVANQRLTLPVAVVMSMLEKERELFQVTLVEGGTKYVNRSELETLEKSGETLTTETLCQPGEMALLTSEELSEFRLVRLNPKSRTDLARLLDLAPDSLEGNPVESRDSNAVQLDLPMFVDQAAVNWILRSLNRQTNQGANLIILNIDDSEGDETACFQLARQLAEYNSNEIRTVAFVRGRAHGPVGLVALSCSHLIMTPSAILGGQDELDPEARRSESELAEIQPLIESLATQKQVDWSMMMAMLDPSLVVSRFRNKQSGQVRLLSNEELEGVEDLDEWNALGQVSTFDGIDAATAEQLFLARTIAENMGQVEAFYQLENSPTPLQQTSTDQWVERVAAYLASPLVATWLLFGAMFFFSTEMSAPGVGLPGFLATICVVLFFWSQNLGGNADWLEIILFVIGAIFILMEIFLLPGLGIFGIGGFLMVVSSIILASQSFLIPRTSEQIAQMPYSVLPVIGAGMGMIAAAVVLRKVIPKSPYLRRMMLVPRQRDMTGLEGQTDPEAMVDWNHLDGQSGDTVTRLHPSGKARISGRVYDVITNGQLIDKGEPIEVVEVQGNRIVVRSLSRKDEE